MTKKPRALERRDILMGFAGAGALASFGAWALGSSLATTNADKTDAERRTSLIDDLLKADAEAALHIGAAPLVAGLAPERVLDAVFLMPMWSHGDRSDIHAMAAVPAIARLVAASPDDDNRLVPVMWAIQEAHVWSGKARASVSEQAPELATVVAQCGQPKRDPHVAIWAAQAGRMLERLPEHRAMILQSIAAYAAFREAPLAVSTASASEPFEQLATLCIEARLTETTETGLGVHMTTLLDALWRMDSPHATAWVTALADQHGRPLKTPLASITAGSGDPFTLAATDTMAAYRAALSAVAKDEAAFRAQVRRRVTERGKNAHDFKYWDAAETIAERLTGDARTRWVASMVGASVVRSDARWDKYDDAKRLLGG